MLLTRKTDSARVAGPRLSRAMGARIATMDRRAFLKRSGLAAGAGAFASQLPYGTIGKAEAQADDGEREDARSSAPSAPTARSAARSTRWSRTASGCARSRCSIRRSTSARTAPRARRCASTATASTACKTPMKLVNGKYQRISWDQALNEISAKMLELRKESGPDSVFWVGSSKHNNEQSYLLRKFVSLCRARNNCDHQARICHSTTVAGVANTWGYGAMTNSYNDMQNTKCALYIGSQRRRGAPGVDAAHAARQGDRREDDRGRPALHAHRGQGRRVRPHPLRHRHPVPVRHAVPHLQERLGRQEVHQRPRLRHGQGQART